MCPIQNAVNIYKLNTIILLYTHVQCSIQVFTMYSMKHYFMLVTYKPGQWDSRIYHS